MFPRGYFPMGYFAPRYFPPVVAVTRRRSSGGSSWIEFVALDRLNEEDEVLLVLIASGGTSVSGPVGA